MNLEIETIKNSPPNFWSKITWQYEQFNKLSCRCLYFYIRTWVAKTCTDLYEVDFYNNDIRYTSRFKNLNLLQF